MIEIAAAVVLTYPRLFANEYCWARWQGNDHDASIELASGTWGGISYTPEADKYIKTYCPFIGVKDETN